VPLRIGEAVVGELLQRWHFDAAAERRPRREAGVVVEDDEDVRRALGRPVREKRIPVGRRVADVELDLALELLRHSNLQNLTAGNPAGV
jgi:hypothetical protein